jgi:hypothetical protein
MKARLWTLSLVLAPLLGCGDDQEFWLPKNNLLPMVALDDRVAFVESNAQTAFLLDPADPSLTPRQVPVGKAPVLAVKRNGANQLLVLSKGDRGSSDELEVPAQLDVIGGAAPTAGLPAVASYPLSGRYDALAQSSDGRFLVLYHSPAGQAQADSALFNPNEMTLVDFNNLALPAKSKTIRSLGGVPSAVLFSPLYSFSAGQRTLAAVLSQNYVTIIDLDNRDNTEISVPLCPQSSGCSINPVQVLFDPRNPTPDAPYVSIYVRASGARDIYQITLTDIGPTTAPDNPFSASLSMLAVGGPASDMALYGSGKNGTRLAVAAADIKSLVIIDPSTSSTIAVPTAIPVSQIVPFALPPSPPATAPRYQALLLDRTSGSSSVLFADLGQVETTRGLALADYSLGASVSDVRPFVEQGIVVLVGGKFSGNAAVTVVDLADRSFSAFGTTSELSLPTFEPRSPSRLWHVDQGTGLCYLNLVQRPSGEARLTTAETWLDQNVTGIVPLAQPSTEQTSDTTRYLVVEHSDPYAVGNLTILDAETPDRATARAAYGFLLSNYLEREQQP